MLSYKIQFNLSHIEAPEKSTTFTTIELTLRPFVDLCSASKPSFPITAYLSPSQPISSLYLISGLDPDAVNVIKKTIELMESKNVQNNLAIISANIGFLIETISKLETSEMLLTESLEIVDNAPNQL
ncbi:hypothetical protein QTP88_026842 [Uroleucon formosanum]